MTGQSVPGLTEGQRQCLRLVLHHKTSKAIARELGVSPHTVDQRLRTAMRALGASSRVEAAMLHARLEGGAGYQPSVYQPSHIAPDEPPLPQAASTGGDRRPVEAELRDHSSHAESEPDAPPPLKLPIDDEGGSRNRLGPWRRLGWIAASAILVLLAFGAFLSGLLALVQLAIEHSRLS